LITCIRRESRNLTKLTNILLTKQKIQQKCRMLDMTSSDPTSRTTCSLQVGYSYRTVILNPILNPIFDVTQFHLQQLKQRYTRR